MGNAPSGAAAAAVKFGDAGEAGAILCTALCRGAPGEAAAAAVLSVGRETVDLFNAATGDRRLRRRHATAPAAARNTCAEARAGTALGFVVAVASDQGDVALLDVATLAELRAIQVVSAAGGGGAAASQTPARPRAATSSPGADAALQRPAPLHITALHIVSRNALLVGLSDGSARAYSLLRGELLRTFGPPLLALPVPAPVSAAPATPSPAGAPSSVAAAPGGSPGKAAASASVSASSKQSGGGARDVVAMAVYNTNPTLLAVGHRDGAVDKYDVASGRFLVTFRLEPGLRCLVTMRRFNCLAGVHEARNTVTIWDAEADRVIQLDFGAELESMGRRLSRMTFARFDDSRSVLLCGDDEGSIYVRSVARIRETNDLAVKLVRVAAPAPMASAPTRVTSMWYDARGDLAFTGDASGLVRVVVRCTGVPWREVTEEARFAAEAGDNSKDVDALLLVGAKPAASPVAAAADVRPVATAAAAAPATAAAAAPAAVVRDLSVARVGAPKAEAAADEGAVKALNAARGVALST